MYEPASAGDFQPSLIVFLLGMISGTISYDGFSFRVGIIWSVNPMVYPFASV